VDDRARGGDVDILVELPSPVQDPAPLAARIAGRISRAMGGRKVDVVLSAPNLRNLPVHDVARREGGTALIVEAGHAFVEQLAETARRLTGA